MAFTHLHVHSHYSLLDGLSKVEEIVDKCIATGMNSVALTDHGNMYGIKDLLDYCKKINKARKADGLEPFKPIVGTEAYLPGADGYPIRRTNPSMPRDAPMSLTDQDGTSSCWLKTSSGTITSAGSSHTDTWPTRSTTQHVSTRSCWKNGMRVSSAAPPAWAVSCRRRSWTVS